MSFVQRTALRQGRQTLYFLLLFTFLAAPLPTTTTAQNNAPQVTVLEHYPHHSLLSTGEALYFRLQYSSTQPLRFQAQSADPGHSKAGTMMNPAPVYPAGEGEALVWIAFQKPFAPQHLSIQVADERWRPLTTLYPTLSVHWQSGVAASRQARPQWVTDLSAQQQRMVSQPVVTTSDEDGSFWLLSLMGWSIPGYLLLQLWAWRHWQDGWRKAVLFPLWIALPILGYTGLALLAGSNLWPLLMLFIFPLLALWLLLVGLLRLIRRR